MTNVTGIRGASPDFNPDDVMGEEQLTTSQFGASSDDEERLGGSGTGGGAKAPFPLVKVLLIGIGVVVIGWTAYSTLAPLLSTKTPPQAVRHGQTMADMQQAATFSAPHSVPQTSTAAPMASPTDGSVHVAQGDGLGKALASPETPSSDVLHSAPPVDGVNSTGGIASAAPAPETTVAQDGDRVNNRLSVIEANIVLLNAQVAALTKNVSAPVADGAEAVKAPRAAARAPTKAISKAIKRNSADTSSSVKDRTPSRGHGAGPKLKAVLVGQAWFQTSSGATLTVSPGDTVPGYGQVQSINVDAGEVRFTDGTVVR